MISHFSFYNLDPTLYIYIYIYKERERESDTQRERESNIDTTAAWIDQTSIWPIAYR